MKKWIPIVSVILVIGFIMGAVVVSANTGTSLTAGLTGSDTVKEARAAAKSTAANITNPLSVADIVEKSSPAVVNIETKVKVTTRYQDPFLNDPFFRQFFGDRIELAPQSRYTKGIGTGFIISEDGYIITNQHVVNSAEEITVKLEGKEKAVPARLVGQDYELDLAVLKIEGQGYKKLPLGNSDKMRVGEWVVAIGEPYGLDHTVTTGVISAKGRPITIEDRNYKNLIQTDAAINPGNSGGPLLNMRGEVIAINTAVNAQAQGIGFAIPINTAKNVLNELIKGGKVVRPYIGISMADVTDEVIKELSLPTNTRGAIVAQVVQASPAAKAGVMYLDVIVTIDGKSISGGTDVQEAIAHKEVGDQIMLGIVRNGKDITLPVVLEAKP